MAKQNGGGFSFGGKPVAESQDTNPGEDGKHVDLSLNGEAKLSREAIEIPDGPQNKDKLDALAFNEEIVTIMVHESTDENAENPIEVGVNGRKQFFIRGREQEVKRKFVEVLARAKVTNYRQNVNASDPQVVNRMVASTALRYPFTLLADPNRQHGGQAWLRKIIQQA